MTKKVLQLQPTSRDIWAQKYQLKDKHGTPIDKDIEQTMERVARTLASVEQEEERSKYTDQFMEALEDGAVPAGRIMSNAGSTEYRSAVSQINCTVSGTIPDSMEGIFTKLLEASLTLKAGCGIGYDWSTLRPKGAHVSGAGASTSGPLSFMDVYDKMCFTISSAGGRRGAQMGTMSIEHPDILDFIKAKREDGRLRHFNLSVLITQKFLDALEAGDNWQFMWDGQPFGAAVPAQEIWDQIMKSTYDYAEPGFLLIDEINRMNTLWFSEEIRATNPCGEQPLPPYGSCLLGSINLTKFVSNAFQPNVSFNFLKFEKVVRTFSRMLDNVVELNGLPLPEQRREILNKRRHGMGILGLGSTMTMLGLAYGSKVSVDFTSRVCQLLAVIGFEEGIRIGAEKGIAPALLGSTSIRDLKPHLYKNSNIVLDKYSYAVDNKALFVASHYFDKWREHEHTRQVLKDLEKYGSRWTHSTSIAPTGTIALSFGNNCSNGLEPSFSHQYIRNVIRPGRNAKEAVDVFSYEFLAYKSLVTSGHIEHVNPPKVVQKLVDRGIPIDEAKHMVDPSTIHEVRPEFVTTDFITPDDHLNVQAAAQEWIDSAISKTINVPTDIPFSNFVDIYKRGVKLGLKGCTTFRFNPENFQGVLVKQEDLKETKYEFTLENGDKVVLSGDELVEYEGQTHTAANLYDSLKEGYYSKF